MSFEEVRFPADISYGSSGGPEFSTDVVETHSGHEKRNINWEDARARYDVAQGVRNQQQLDSLVSFFRARKGRAIGFRFKDWTDFQATGEIIGTGDGVEVNFQLIRSYASGSAVEQREIKKPVAGTVNIYVDDVLQSSGVSTDTTTGIVTFTTAPANSAVIKADFEFDVPVRFDTDRFTASLDSFGSSSWQDITLIEIRI